MNQTLKRALTALFSLLLIVSAALSLPRAMDSVMAGSLTTQVVFAQVEAEEPETGNISPTPMPVVTLQPTCEATPMEKNNALTPLPEAAPTPMPPEGFSPDASLAQPLPWRNQLTPMAKEGAEIWTAKLKTFSIIGHSLDQTDLVTNYYLTPDENLNLAEAIQPNQIALQKLLQGILDNLDNHPKYVPDKTVLDKVMNLPIASILLPADGQHSLFLATQAQRLPLAVLNDLSSKGKRTVTYSEYTSQRDLMVSEAQKLVSSNPDMAMDESAALVAQIMNGDKPWQPAIIQITPYACNVFWDYYLAGHHVKAVDMETGKQYTLTTDLISGKVVGFTLEEGEPYLIAYQKLLTDAQTLQNLPEDEVAKAKETAIGLSKQLVEGDDLTNSDFWMISVTAFTNASKETHGWNISFSQTDEEARILDPSITSPPIAYTMVLDDEYHLVAWTASNIPQSAVGHAISIDRKGFDDFDETLDQFLQAEYMKDPAFIERVKLIVNNRDQIFQETHEKVEMLFPGATFSGVEQLYLEEQTYEGGMVITQVFFQPTFLTANGKTLSVSSLVKDDDTIQITGILDAANYDRIVTP
ncbi:MAG: hypothetical protein ACOX6Y_05125 [Christensenellales bacterium]